MKLPDIHTVHTKRNHLNLRRIFAAPIITIALVSLLSTSLPFGIDTKTASAADTIFYDFIAQAPYASWGSGAGSLPFPGSDSDSRGFACYRDNAQLEDNSTRTRVLETHPQWTSNGWIMGRYPQLTIPVGAELRVAVGFLKGATGTDGATFEVQFEEGQKRQTILSYRATYDGKIDSITLSLSPLAGRTGHLILRVNAGQSSGQDWAAWAEARIETVAPPAPPAPPDLIVDRIECGPGNKLSVTIKNVGSGALPGGWIAVAEAYFDGAKRGAFDLKHPTSTVGGGIAKPGGSSTYLVAWDIARPVIVRVLVDPTNNITESNEQNNIREQKVEPCEIALPDLVVVDIRQEGNTIRYKIQNVGQGSVANPLGGTTPFCNALFIDGELVAKDCVNIHEMLPGQWIDNPFDYYWEMTPPQHTIKVCADWDQDVNEKNEGNNCLEQTWYMEEKLPDLIIEVIKCDQENSQIGYVVKNIGEEQGKAGHATTLYVDDEEVSHDLVSVDLKSGASYESWFKEYEWPECKAIKVKICADNYNQVTETDEQNNCQEETCECIVDITPPRIISGPTVSQVTQTSVVICWGTDEASDSRTGYDYRSGEYGRVLEDSNLVKEHCLSLTKLAPATTYHFIVESADSSGNKVMSRDLSFETPSLPDVEKPSLSLLIPDTLSGTVPISADTEDNIGVDRVVFFCDGKPVFTDFSAPFEWECDTGVLDEGFHHFETQSFDSAGNMAEVVYEVDVRNRFPVDLSPVHVRIITPEVIPPESRAEVYGEVLIGVEVTHDLGYGIKNITVEVDGEVICEKPYTKGYYMDVGPGLEPIWVVTGYPEPPVYETCVWDAGVEWDSTHIIEVSAQDKHENWGHASMSVIIARPRVEAIPRPSIRVFRDVTRSDNYFEVTLTIENIGDVDISDITIADLNWGFQCINKVFISIGGDGFGPPVPCSVSYSTVAKSSQLGYQYRSLRAGNTLKVRYYVVPILFDPREEPHIPTIGDRFSISYQAGGRTYSEEPRTRWSTSEGPRLAFLGADYLIVTNPSALFTHYDDDYVNKLLATMAELAKEKNGVLGYLPSSGVMNYSVKSRISPGGAWYEKLAPFDYLLIVGESEIVPAWRLSCPGFFMDDTGGIIEISDYLYSDISGDKQPELKVGRIIGSNAEELLTPIQASLDVHKGSRDYDGSDVLLVTGYEGTWEASIKNAEGGRVTLGGKGVTVPVPIVHTEYYTTEHNMLAEALRIKGPDAGGAAFDPNPPMSTFTVEQLAVWLLDSEGVYWALWAIEYEEFTDSEGRQHRWAPAYIGDEEVQQALRIAERIQADREGRGGAYGWTYTYCSTGEEVLRRKALQVKAQTPNKDVILFKGHGGPGSWACVLDDWTTSECPIEPINFGSSRPIVIAFSCLTGNYEDEPGRSIARAFLRNGAGIYIGSTEVSSTGHNEEVTREGFWRGWSRSSRIGDAFFDLQRRKIREGGNWRYFVYEYNLYGDPKFGE